MALAESPTGGDRRGIRRRHRDQRDRDRARRADEVLTLSDRLRPPGHRLRRRLDPRLPGVDLRRPARGGGARRGPRGPGARAEQRDRLPAADRLTGRTVAVVEVAARIPGGQMADLVRHAAGSTWSRSRSATRSARRCPTRWPAAVPAAARDPLPHCGARAAADRRRDAIGSSTRCSTARASCRPTPTSRSARRSGRSGSTATAAATSSRSPTPRRGARPRRARGRQLRVEVELDELVWTSTDYRDLLDGRTRRAATGRAFEGAPTAGSPSATTSTSRSTPRSAWPSSSTSRACGDLLPDDRVGLLQPRLERRRRARSRSCGRSGTASASTPSTRTRSWTTASTP